MDDELVLAGRLEDGLYDVPGVVAARVSGWGGDDADIGLLVRHDADADEVTRRVRSLVESETGVTHVPVRVVRLDAGSRLSVDGAVPGRATPAVGDRARLRRVMTATEGNSLRAEVSLADSSDVSGSARGRRGPSSWPVTVAEATLEALARMHPQAAGAFVESAQVVEIGGREVATVLVVLPDGHRDEVLLGAAVLRSHDRSDGFARAVLDATNRRLPFLR